MGALAPLVIFGIQELIKYEPQIAAAIGALFAKTDATEADWTALRTKYARQSYESIVTESGLKPTP
jgi:hypothetical protein